MATLRSRTAQPVTDRPRGLTMGMYGMIVLLVVLSTGLAGLATAGLYLHTGQPAWPPEPLVRPGSWLAVGATLLAIGGAVALTFAAVRLRRDEHPAPSLLMLISGLLLAGSVLLLGRDLGATPFHWSDHAYASVYVVNTASALVFVAIGALMVAGVLIQRLVGLVDSRRMLELDVAAVFVWWTVLAVVVCLAIAHLLPDPGGAT